MDLLWLSVVAKEQNVLATMRLNEIPKDFSTDPGHLVTPFNDLDAPLFVVSSYPSMISAHLNYSTVNYMSNPCIPSLYTN
jgi:hypothetical protein